MAQDVLNIYKSSMYFLHLRVQITTCYILPIVKVLFKDPGVFPTSFPEVHGVETILPLQASFSRECAVEFSGGSMTRVIATQ